MQNFDSLVANFEKKQETRKASNEVRMTSPTNKNLRNKFLKARFKSVSPNENIMKTSDLYGTTGGDSESLNIVFPGERRSFFSDDRRVDGELLRLQGLHNGLILYNKITPTLNVETSEFSFLYYDDLEDKS